jgi:hypothetical protein
LVERDLQLRFEVVCAKIKLDAWVLVPRDCFVLFDDSICVAWVEGFIVDAFWAVFARRTVEIDVEALIRIGDPYMILVNYAPKLFLLRLRAASCLQLTIIQVKLHDEGGRTQ